MDISSILFLIIVIGGYILKALGDSTPKPTSKTPNSSSLSDIKKYLEEMSGNTPQAKSASPSSGTPQATYTQPYGYKKQSTPTTTTTPVPSAQRGWNELMEASSSPKPPQTQKKKKKAATSAEAIALSASASPLEAKNSTIKEKGYDLPKKTKGGVAAASSPIRLEKLNLPGHLSDIQKAILLAEIFSPPKSLK